MSISPVALEKAFAGMAVRSLLLKYLVMQCWEEGVAQSCPYRFGGVDKTRSTAGFAVSFHREINANRQV